MAEFSEVMKQYKRMCHLGNGCEECVLHDMNVRPCLTRAKKYPAEFERRVMEWAARHPKPVYPRWSEWLDAMGYDLFFHIPADIAEKLGVRPKEADHD